jgi:hypothetical protein
MMIRDEQVRKYMKLRAKGTNQEVAALHSGMNVKTARRYERAGQLPSEMRRPHDWSSRPNPFAQDWDWVVEQLQHDPALQGATLFQELCLRRPDTYQPVQVRTLQRHIARWRAQQGPEREVIFEQVHVPAERMQTDFTHMEDLHITIGGQPFPHLLHHSVLTYSNVEAIQVCFGETFEALAEGIEAALWQFGGVPEQHRTDHLGAAIHPLPALEQEAFKARYAGLMRHYGMRPTLNNTGIAHENGDVEQSHYRFKQAVDQALRVRGSREFASRARYERFLGDLVRRRNETRAARWAEEQAHLRPLPTAVLAPCRELTMTVSRFSTIQVLGNTYSVPSRMIGAPVLVRVRAEHLEVYVGGHRTEILPRLQGKGHHAINYRHVIWSLMRKPGAFAQYRYREEFFPQVVFRQAYDHLRTALGDKADGDYLRVLHLAATTSETEVSAAVSLLLEAQMVPRWEAVRALVQPVTIPPLPAVLVDLAPYDGLLRATREVEYA